MNEEWKVVADAIPIGRENAISREALALKVGMTDRVMRSHIEEARNEGCLICNDGNGYYHTNDIRDIERQYKKDRSRALNVLKRLKSMRQTLRAAGVKV